MVYRTVYGFVAASVTPTTLFSEVSTKPSISTTTLPDGTVGNAYSQDTPCDERIHTTHWVSGLSKSSVAVVMGINFSEATSTKSVTITDLSMMANVEIYKLIAGGGLVAIQVSVSKGKAVMSFTSDPDFVVQNVTGVYTKDLLTGKNTTYLPIW